MDRQSLDHGGIVERVNLRVDGKADSFNGLVFRPCPVQIDKVRHASHADLCFTGNGIQNLASLRVMSRITAPNEPE